MSPYPYGFPQLLRLWVCFCRLRGMFHRAFFNSKLCSTTWGSLGFETSITTTTFQGFNTSRFFIRAMVVSPKQIFWGFEVIFLVFWGFKLWKSSHANSHSNKCVCLLSKIWLCFGQIQASVFGSKGNGPKFQNLCRLHLHLFQNNVFQGDSLFSVYFNGATRSSIYLSIFITHKKKKSPNLDFVSFVFKYVDDCEQDFEKTTQIIISGITYIIQILQLV